MSKVEWDGTSVGSDIKGMVSLDEPFKAIKELLAGQASSVSFGNSGGRGAALIELLDNTNTVVASIPHFQLNQITKFMTLTPVADGLSGQQSLDSVELKYNVDVASFSVGKVRITVSGANGLQTVIGGPSSYTGVIKGNGNATLEIPFKVLV